MKQPIINKLLTPYNFTNANGRKKDFIVIHYVGALGGAKENCQYSAGRYVGASAHLYVGFVGEIWMSVEIEDIAWHTGASTYKHPECRNANSIGIELCVRKRNTKNLGSTDQDWYFEDATVDAAVELTRYLMETYNIPASNVIRHYDVTGKICPNPYVYNTTSHTWDEFKRRIGEPTGNTQGTQNLYRVRKSWADVKSQIGAYASLDNAKKVCAAGYTVYDQNGRAVYEAGAALQQGTAQGAGVPFDVRVDITDLRIRTGAGIGYAFTGEYTGIGKFNITEVREGRGSVSGWGKLKSGAGWISLDYAKRV